MVITIKSIASILLLVISTNLLAFDNTIGGETYLYVKSISDKKDLDSITYLFGIREKEQTEILNIFQKFSDIIGSNNGAAIISSAEFITESAAYLDGYGDKDLFSDILKNSIEIMSDSTCDFPKTDRSYVVYENLNSKNCIYLDFQSPLEVMVLLSDITKIINNKKNLNQVEIERNLESTIQEYHAGDVYFSGIKNELRKLSSMLLSKLYK